MEHEPAAVNPELQNIMDSDVLLRQLNNRLKSTKDIRQADFSRHWREVGELSYPPLLIEDIDYLSLEITKRQDTIQGFWEGADGDPILCELLLTVDDFQEAAKRFPHDKTIAERMLDKQRDLEEYRARKKSGEPFTDEE